MHRSTYPVTEREASHSEIIKTASVYHDRKTIVPKEILDYLHVTAGSGRIVWLIEDGAVCVESAVQKT